MGTKKNKEITPFEKQGEKVMKTMKKLLGRYKKFIQLADTVGPKERAKIIKKLGIKADKLNLELTKEIEKAQEDDLPF